MTTSCLILMTFGFWLRAALLPRFLCLSPEGHNDQGMPGAHAVSALSKTRELVRMHAQGWEFVTCDLPGNLGSAVEIVN